MTQFQYSPTIIFRHNRENLKKCSLVGLELRDDFLFYTYPKDILPEGLDNYFLLSFDGPQLTKADRDKGIFLIDGTWKYAEKMQSQLQFPPDIHLRSLPPMIQTAYPRRQEGCPLPQRGLSSLEALYVSFKILGKDTSNLLENYYWKEQFLRINEEFFSTI